TWCCGYCCALPNGKGVLGLTANRKLGTTAQLYSYKMLGNDGFGRPNWTHAALEAAIDERIDVISASWGSGYPDPIMEKLINHFIQRGGYFFAAAGNSGRGEHLGARPDEDYPAYYPNVAGVAAVDSKGRLTDFSSYGPGVVCCAPGYEMLSTIPGGYGLM